MDHHATEHSRTFARSVARQLLDQYGEDAEVIATLRAAEVAAQADTDALAHWDLVILFLGEGDLRSAGETIN